MTTHDNFHSTLVAWLKVLLPLVALAILSTLFLVSHTIDPSDAIPFAEVDIAERVREPRLTAPTWAGVTDDGAALTISAAIARPQQDEETGAQASKVAAKLETPDGGLAELIADHGMLDTTAEHLTVAGDVKITTSTGYQISSDAMTAALNRTSLISEGPVTALGPVGTIDSGSMEMRQDTSEDGTYLLVFKDGVKLLYKPSK